MACIQVCTSQQIPLSPTSNCRHRPRKRNVAFHQGVLLPTSRLVQCLCFGILLQSFAHFPFSHHLPLLVPPSPSHATTYHSHNVFCSPPHTHTSSRPYGCLGCMLEGCWPCGHKDIGPRSWSKRGESININGHGIHTYRVHKTKIFFIHSPSVFSSKTKVSNFLFHMYVLCSCPHSPTHLHLG